MTNCFKEAKKKYEKAVRAVLLSNTVGLIKNGTSDQFQSTKTLRSDKYGDCKNAVRITNGIFKAEVVRIQNFSDQDVVVIDIPNQVIWDSMARENKKRETNPTTTSEKLNLRPPTEEEKEGLYYFMDGEIVNLDDVSAYNRIELYEPSTLNPNSDLNYNSTEYINFKRTLIDTVKTKLESLKIQKSRKENRKNVNIKQAIFELEEMLGTLELELSELLKKENITNLDFVFAFYKVDLQRAIDLVNSNNISNFKEATKIVEFYHNLGIFDGEVHPLFDKELIYDEKGVLIPEMEPIRKRLQDISNEFHNKIDSVIKEAREKRFKTIILSNSKFQKMFSGETEDTIKELLDQKEIDDIGWIDLWASNSASNIFSTDSLIPQIARNELSRNMDEELSYTSGLQEEIDRVQERAEKELSTKTKGFLRAKDYSIFLQKTRDGKKTGRIVNIFSKLWYDAYEGMKKEYNSLMQDAKETNFGKDYEKAYKHRDDWLRENVDILDITKIKDIEDYMVSIDSDYADMFTKHTEKEKEAYTNKLKEILGKQYNDIIKKQIEAIDNYTDWYDNFEKTTLLEHGKKFISELTPEQEFTFNLMIIRNSPFELADSWNKGNDKIKWGDLKTRSFMNYNIYIPKQKRILVENLKLNPTTKQWDFTEREEDTNYYDEEFNKIQNNDALYDMWKVLYKSVDYINDAFFDNYTKIKKGSIPTFDKSLMDTILQSEGGFMMKTLYWLKEWIKRKISLSQSEQKIKEASTIESINKNMKTDASKEIGDLVNLKVLEYERVNHRKIDKETYNQLKEDITDEYYQDKSQDLLRIIRTALDYAAEYKARQNSLADQELLKGFYDDIKRQVKSDDTNKKNTLTSVISKFSRNTELNKERIRAKKRYDYWFNKTVKGNFDTDVWGVYKPVTEEEYTTSLGRLLHSGKIYTKDEKELLKQVNTEIQGLNKRIDDEKDKNEKENLIKKRNRLLTMRDNFGRNFAVSAVYNSLFDFIRFRGLSWNFHSLVTNRIEGWLTNQFIDTLGIWFTPGNIIKANWFLSLSTPRKYLRKVKGNDEYQKFVLFFEKTKLLQDASNEMQRNSFKSGLKNINKVMDPFYLPITKVEIKNQGALVLARLMDIEIKGTNGSVKVFENNEFPAFEIIDGVLKLKPEFRTEENIATWENMVSEEFSDLKANLTDMITQHGDFSKLGGMKAKSNPVGKAITMFRTWLPKQIQLRWGKEQQNLDAETKIKGFYRSHTPVSAAITAGIAGISLANPLLAVVGAVGAYSIYYVNHKKHNIKTEINDIKQLALIGKNVAKKLLGLPLNVVGINALTSSDVDKIYKSNDVVNNRNMRAIVVDISIMLGLLLAKIIAKSLTWDDDDDTMEQKRKRRLHNVLENKISALISNATQYINLRGLYDTQVKISFLNWYDDVFKVMNEADEMFEEGNTFMEKLNKVIIPAGLQDITTLNTKKYMDRDFTPGEWLDEVFMGNEEQNKDEYEAIRKQAKEDMTEKLKRELSSDEYDNLTDRDIWKEVNKIYRIRKKGETYEDMLNLYDEIDSTR